MANGALPDGWNWMTIGDVADTTSGGTPSRKYPEYFEGTIPWVKSGELGDGLVSVTEEKITKTAIKNSSAKIFPTGSVLVALYGATVGKVGILNIDAATNQAVCALFPKNNSFIAKYMFYWLMSQRQDLINKSMGGAQPNISQGIVRSHPFPLAPLPEQERIVSRIEELFSDLDAGVAALERVRAGLKRYKASVLKSGCEGKLVNGNSGIGDGELPKGWQWVTVGDVSNFDVGYAFKSAEFTDKGIKLLRGDNIEPGSLRWIDTRYWSDEKLEPYKNLLIDEGNIILAMDRPLISSGLKIAQAKKSDLPCLLVQRMARFRPNSSISNDYLFITLQTQSFIAHLFKEQTGTQLPHISAKDIMSFEIPLPPLDEQRRIVAEVERRLSVVGEVESTVEAGLARSARLRQSVLRSAFEGRL